MNINENNDNLTVNQNEKIDEIKETLEETSHTIAFLLSPQALIKKLIMLLNEQKTKPINIAI